MLGPMSGPFFCRKAIFEFDHLRLFAHIILSLIHRYRNLCQCATAVVRVEMPAL